MKNDNIKMNLGKPRIEKFSKRNEDIAYLKI
jgi:hypothetical protein